MRDEIAKARADIDEAAALELANAVLAEVAELPDRDDDTALKAAVLKAVAKWASTESEPKSPRPETTHEPVATKRSAPYFTKRSEVTREADRLAKIKMAAEPERYTSLAAARAAVWRERNDLVKAYYDTPEGQEMTFSDKDIIQKTAAENGAFAEIQVEAERLVKESGYTISESEARLRVSRARPDLYEHYELEKRAGSR